MRRNRLLAAILNGIALPNTLYGRHQFKRLNGTDLDRLRGDVAKVGGDFNTVIAREHGKHKKISGSATASQSFP